jgi:Flp pilus assembly protein TadG
MATLKDHTRSSLNRLLRDSTANTLAMTAAALVPLIGMVGGAVDMSRVYLAKSRLQSACDAGALAARRTMPGTTWNDASNQVGLDYFNMNFPIGKYGTDGRSISYAANDEGAVTGTASVRVPMTLMKIFDVATSTVAVSCTANLNLPNTDVMMVLDTTLSMNDPNPGDSVRRIDALSTAVMGFFDTLELAKPAGANIRYGFVPYSHTVNVGRLLHRDWVQNFGEYDSRVPDGTHEWTTQGSVQGPERTVTTPWQRVSGSNNTRPRYQAPSENCPTSLPRENWSDNTTNSAWTPSATALPRSRTQTRVRNGTEFSIARDSSGNCWITPRDFVQFTETRTQTREANPNAGNGGGTNNNTAWHWLYQPVTYDLRPLKGNGAGNEVVSGGSFIAPVSNNHANRTIRWPDGDLACIEERATRRTDELLSARHDMDVDLIPDPSNPATQWKPYLPGVVFSRTLDTNNRETETRVSTNVHENGRWIFSGLTPTSTRTMGLTTTRNFYNPTGGNFGIYEGACPSPARKMGAITRAQLQTYIGSLRPQGYTYHEIGMLWGLRLISREGLFSEEHLNADAGGAVQRHVIFMVDGQKDTRPFTYSAWGIAATARRRTPTGQFPTRAMEDQVSEDRLIELCTLAKNNKNITLWVIAFGTDLDATLTNCASPGRAYQASNAAELTATFANIATQMAELRLTN